MSADGHHTAAQIRSRLDHPVIDGDGHWVEFDPVFSDRMRKVGGDRAADGFLAAMKTTHDALSMSVAERRRRRIAQPDFRAPRKRAHFQHAAVGWILPE